MKTTIEIADDVCAYLRTTALKTSINGVMRSDRPIPPDSMKEDVWVHSVAAESGQIQEAIVYVNVYVPDEYNATEKQYELAKGRIKTLAALCISLLKYQSIDDYHFEYRTQSVEAVDGVNKHFISTRLLYRHNTNT